MNVNDTEILICNCGKTMPLDPKKIATGWPQAVCKMTIECQDYKPFNFQGK